MRKTREEFSITGIDVLGNPVRAELESVEQGRRLLDIRPARDGGFGYVSVEHRYVTEWEPIDD